MTQKRLKLSDFLAAAVVYTIGAVLVAYFLFCMTINL